MDKLVEFIARNLVERPDQVRVRQRRYRERIVLHLRVAREDTGRVIGKQGRVANAMRAVLHAAAQAQRRPDVELKIQ